MNDPRLTQLRSKIRDIPDFPKPGILFKDITPLLADGAAFASCLDLFSERFAPKTFDVVIGIESRGFIFGAALAAKLGKAFVPVRKPGKLPARTLAVSYALEYGSDTLEMHQDALVPGERALLVDDLIATGGTACAAAELVRRVGGQVIGAAFVIELGFLSGVEKLKPVETFSLLRYE